LLPQQDTAQPRLEALIALRQAAELLRRRLEAVDDRLFQRLRAEISHGALAGAALKARIDSYIDYDATDDGPQAAIGYDSLDLFINRLLLTAPIPAETKAREPGMIYYQKTPARVMLDLLRQAELTGQDVFYDIGSGLGQVPILVSLLSGARASGVEFEPAYCAYAQACAAALNLPQVSFMAGDARQAAYAEGTVFFMYTPFEGAMLQAVLDKLGEESRKRMFRLFTYGPCTPAVAQQRWLTRLDGNGDQIYKLGVFRTL
jgi:hypothetical protein